MAGAKKGGEGRGGEIEESVKWEREKRAFPFPRLPNSLSLFPPFPSPLDACHVGQRGCAHSRLGFWWPFLLVVYCLYRHFVTDYLLTSVRKFGNNILQLLIFVIPGEKWTKELKASGGKTWLVESYVHFMKREGAKNVLQYGIYKVRVFYFRVSVSKTRKWLVDNYHQPWSPCFPSHLKGEFNLRI